MSIYVHKFVLIYASKQSHEPHHKLDGQTHRKNIVLSIQVVKQYNMYDEQYVQ